MDSWDSEPSGAGAVKMTVDTKGRWEGEDADEHVVDSWDQEEDEEEEEGEEEEDDDDDGEYGMALSPVLPTKEGSSKKTIKKIGDKFEEKEKRKKELGKTNDESFKDFKDMTPEERLAEKLKQQKLQEESDLTLAKEVFGVLGNSGLETKDDFDRLKEDILKLVAECSKDGNYTAFTEEIVHSLCIHLSSPDIKKIHTWLGNLHIEKSKLEKGEKKKPKGKGKAKLKMEGDNDFTEYSNYSEDFEDFI